MLTCKNSVRNLTQILPKTHGTLGKFSKFLTKNLEIIVTFEGCAVVAQNLQNLSAGQIYSNSLQQRFFSSFLLKMGFRLTLYLDLTWRYNGGVKSRKIRESIHYILDTAKHSVYICVKLTPC